MSSPYLLTVPIQRVSQACDRCRARKVRCIPSKDPEVCKSCFARGIVCTFSSSEKPRRANYKPRKQPDLPVHSSQSPQPGSSVYDVAGPILGLNSSYSYSDLVETDEFKKFHRKAFEQLLPKTTSGSAGSSGVDASGPTIALKSHTPNTSRGLQIEQGLSETEINQCLSRYAELQRYFPFVPLPRQWSVQNMREEHPFLLIGILSAMTVHETGVNSRLHTEFLRIIAEKVVVHGEKSLDIIQGILVQVAWFPVHLKPRSLQVFQILQMAVSMIIDLHFDEAPEDIESLFGTTPGNFQSREELFQSIRLAYLGGHFLSSVISVCFRRPNNLPYSDYTDSCVRQMTSINANIAWDIKSQQLIEKADKAVKNEQLDATAATGLLATLNNNLDVLIASQPYENQQTPRFELRRHYVAMRITAVALKGLSLAERSAPTNPHNSNWRLPILSQCLVDTKDFFWAFAELPLSEYRNMTFMEWTQLCQAFKITSKLCHYIPSVPEWDVSRAQKEVQLGITIESLCYRMQELTSIGKLEGHQVKWRIVDSVVDAFFPPDQFYMVQSGLNILKEVYDESVKVARQGNGEHQRRKHGSRCPVLNGTIMASNYGEALQYNNTIGLETDGLFNDGVGELDFNLLQGWEFDGNGLVGLMDRDRML